jgi:AraC-like DNA-binding protein
MQAIGDGKSGGFAAACRRSPEGHIQFRCRAPRDAEAVIGQVFERRFDFKVFDPAAFDFRLDHFACGSGVSVSRMAFGSEVEVSIERVESFMVQMPLTGRNDLTLDGTVPLPLSSRLFSVINPGRSLRQRRHENCEMILVRFDEKLLSACLAAQLAEADDVIAHRPIKFSADMSTARPGGSAWMRMMSFVLGELDKKDSIFRSPLAASQAGNLMMSTLLLNQPHSYSDFLQQSADEPVPRSIRNARNWIETNAHRPVTVDDIARAVNLSTRSLYNGFRKYLDQTPMDYLKDVRLAKARSDLLTATASKNVTAIAMEWGFTHLGHFARDYQMKFGELPSRTLRASRER